ncbi:hypothetical protein Q7P37_007310 [Cladosporium fusiforme]
MQRVIFPRRFPLDPPFIITPSFPRTYASKRGPSNEYSEEDLAAARKWLANLDADTIPRNLCEITFSRSSGPGGQNVNKYVPKLSLSPDPAPKHLRAPNLTKIPHPESPPKPPSASPRPPSSPSSPESSTHPLLSSRYHAPKTSALIIQADDARKQADNAAACFKKLHALIREIAAAAVPNETGAGQAERVAKLQKAEAAGRRRMKEALSRKKSARRSGGRGED